MSTVSYETPECMFCHQTSVVELTPDEIAGLAARIPIQEVMPDRPAPERELIRSGIHPTCWTENFG